MTAMFVSLLSFFYKVSDATVGGMYMTVLKTAFDFGRYRHSNATVHRLQIRPTMHNYSGTPYHSPMLHLDPCSTGSVGMRPRTDRRTHSYARQYNPLQSPPKIPCR